MPYRKHIRLKEYDYSSENFYFVTICTSYRIRLFEPRVSERHGQNVVRTSSLLKVARQEKQNTNTVEKILVDLPRYYDNLFVDFYVIMPNHLHVIVGFEGKITVKNKPTNSRHYTLGEIINMFKQISTKQIHKLTTVKGAIFQPNYYEHIIRNDKSLEQIREYILNNPFAEYQEIPWRSLDR